MTVFPGKLSLFCAIAVGLAGCANLPAGLGPDPVGAGGSALVYMPAAAGVPARLERFDVPDNRWRSQEPPPPPIGPTIPAEPEQIGRPTDLDLAHERSGAFDIVAAALPAYLDAAPAGSLPELLLSTPPAPVDGVRFPTSARIETRRCGPDAMAYFAAIMAHVCRAPSGTFRQMWFYRYGDGDADPVALARFYERERQGFALTPIRERLVAAGLTMQRRVNGPQPYPHLPLPEDFTMFAPPKHGPVVVVRHDRGSAKETVRQMLIYLPGS